MAEISNYDHFDYNYEEYWKKRKYENEAEKTLLSDVFSKYKGKWFLDIGGSYGRLTSTYYNNYSNPIILDYSFNTLSQNYEIIKSKYPNTELIAANAYRLPFKEDSFDGALMVRVLHHIEKPAEYFNQLERILHNNSVYVQEFANKIHIKAKIRALLKGDLSIFSQDPYQQPSSHNFEGTKKGEEALFYNYHPKHIKTELKKQKFHVKKKYGCSFLRSQGLKRVIGEDTMITIEKILQKLLSWTNIPPSLIYESILKEDSKKKQNLETLKDILQCPSCHSDFTFNENTAKCTKCKKEFFKKDNIWDFRID